MNTQKGTSNIVIEKSILPHQGFEVMVELYYQQTTITVPLGQQVPHLVARDLGKGIIEGIT